MRGHQDGLLAELRELAARRSEDTALLDQWAQERRVTEHRVERFKHFFPSFLEVVLTREIKLKPRRTLRTRRC